MTELAIAYANEVEVPGQYLRYGFENPAGEGCAARGDLLVSAGTGLAVNVAAGTSWVRGRSITDQGMYRCRNSASKSSADFEAGGIPANASGNPRIDQIIAKVYDHDADASGQRKWRLEVLPGVATPGADLDDRLGAIAPLPDNCIRLADVLVASGASSLTGAEIRDRRRFALRSTIPPILFPVTAVGMEPSAPLIGERTSFQGSTHDNRQAAVAMFLPRRQTATARIRWKYVQGSTALTGSYVIAIYDAMGYLMADTGPVAFAGAADAVREEIKTIPSTEFDGGVYYVLIGLDTGATGSVALRGVGTALDPSVNRDPGAPARNLALRKDTGGTTAPPNLLGFTDVCEATAVSHSPPVPLIGLSVGG